MPAQIPIALACSPGSGKAWLMIASVPGSSRAAPTPCSTRAPTSSPALGAAPQASEATPKTPSPTRTIRLWPCRSPTAPPTSIRLARAMA